MQDYCSPFNLFTFLNLFFHGPYGSIPAPLSISSVQPSASWCMAFQDLYYYSQEIKLIHDSVTIPTLPKPPGAVEEIYHI